MKVIFATLDNLQKLAASPTWSVDRTFKSPLTEHVTCILFAEYPGNNDIDNNRNITVQ
jgi:hypothetical protein